jgi:hypothetical protein
MIRISAVAFVALVGVQVGAQQEEEFWRKQGVYVECERGVLALTGYVEVTDSEGVRDYSTPRSTPPETMMRAFELTPLADVPKLSRVVSFVLNMTGRGSDLAASASQLYLILVEPTVPAPRMHYVPLTARVEKHRPTVYRVVSPQLGEGDALQRTYRQRTRDEKKWGPAPEAFVALLMQPNEGMPRRLYAVRAFPR